MVDQLIIGVDCATDDAKIGLARAERRKGRTTITEAVVCTKSRSATGTVAEWLRGVASPALLAIDAPLGWPIDLGRRLVSHRAGQAIEVDPNLLFRRATDRFVQATLGKIPLDVGADRIARTAHAALQLLGDLRTSLALEIPLAMSPTIVGVSVVEVYPAATLVANGIRSSGYKKPSQIAERREIARPLSRWIDCRLCLSVLETNADVLDSAVCVLAAVDFLEGSAAGPADALLAAHEGWIWARRRRA